MLEKGISGFCAKSVFLWRVPDSCQKVASKLNDDMQIYHTGVMRQEFVNRSLP